MVSWLENCYLNEDVEMDTMEGEIDFVLNADNYYPAEMQYHIFDEVNEVIRLEEQGLVLEDPAEEEF